MGIHKEGHGIIFKSFLLIAVIVVALYFILGMGNAFYISAAAAALLFFIIVRFFRSPKRIPVQDNSAVLAPADGRIVIVKEVYEGEYLKRNCIQVSIFMSIFNVHVNWFPVKGVVKYYKYHPGNYLVAMHPKSSEKNERTTIVVDRDSTPVLFRQIAGLLARRIVCYAKEGSVVTQGEQVGFIKFGSRVDLFLPIESRIQVTRGQKVKGTQTIIARLPEPTENEPKREADFPESEDISIVEV
ncbi:MAG: phosphatidylserine decarboxylase family protein [Bacteroidales bacterium]|nr:phosphatidylserine decarboxylase family protein [Bacteroidales bacterium]